MNSSNTLSRLGVFFLLHIDCKDLTPVSTLDRVPSRYSFHPLKSFKSHGTKSSTEDLLYIQSTNKSSWSPSQEENKHKPKQILSSNKRIKKETASSLTTNKILKADYPTKHIVVRNSIHEHPYKIQFSETILNPQKTKKI